MCRLQLDLIFIFKMAATRIGQKVKMRHSSLTSHHHDHMKTNKGATPMFSGTGSALVRDIIFVI